MYTAQRRRWARGHYRRDHPYFRWKEEKEREKREREGGEKQPGVQDDMESNLGLF